MGLSYTRKPSDAGTGDLMQRYFDLLSRRARELDATDTPMGRTELAKWRNGLDRLKEEYAPLDGLARCDT